MLFVLALIAFFATAFLVPLLAALLNKKGIVDQPIERSSHDIPTPRGAGLVVMPVIFALWGFLLWRGMYVWPDQKTFLAVILCGALLCAFTWLDDHKPGGLTVKIRLLVQLLAVSIPLAVWPADLGRIFPEIVPLVAERIMLALAWVWFANLYNFMDGINGISGAEAISITGGLLIYCFAAAVDVPPGYAELLVIPLAASAGFLVWNARRVAKIFLGDVGSVGLGYCLAWLLFVFAARGYLMPAALVTLVYSMDASVTLLKRAWQKKKIWQSHREHFYHRATVKGALSHHQCVGIIVAINAVLIAIGLALLHGLLPPVLGFFLGMALVTCLLVCFYQIGERSGHVSSPRPKAFRIERLGRVFIKRLRAERK